LREVDGRGVVADEVAIEKDYNDALKVRAKSLRHGINQMTANTWTTTRAIEVPASGELIGRVALEEPSGLLDGARDFYIGTAKYEGDDYQVFSWVAPVACTYYRKSNSHHDLCDSVVGVRVLAHRGGRIVDYQDESSVGAGDEDLFPKRQLQIPRAPVKRPTPHSAQRSRQLPQEEDATTGVTHLHSEITRPILVPPRLPGFTGPVAPAAAQPPPGPALRAAELLRRELAAPKAVTMSAVLATLQSDQYEAITRPVSESQVLQGHPGTGKTIIAAHRAAYLLNGEAPREARPRGRVLILGPTAEYVEHVQGALRKLIADAERYVVTSMPALLEELAELPQSKVPTESVHWEDVSPDLARLVDLAYTRARMNLRDETPTAGDVYAELVWLLEDPPQQGLDGEWVRYLRKLPGTFDELRRRRISSFRGLLAYIGARTIQVQEIGHVIVDEAQDIHPIEWETLGRLGNAGGWTILGDLNQRRTDHTFSSWDEVAQLLAIEVDDGSAPVQVLERGYRSTAQIIRFANQLLPSRDRVLYSLQQDGEVPEVRRVPSARDLSEATFSAATMLLDRCKNGTVAIITVEPRSVSKLLTRRSWRADISDPNTWRNASQTLKLLTPERARGLEFDGVVVVEPSNFPENVGRQGVLYTALTRANRLLTVVHHRALPRGMKAWL
jgi:DNA helicase-2/ATP-dependent DNA helicase PcrA